MMSFQTSVFLAYSAFRQIGQKVKLQGLIPKSYLFIWCQEITYIPFPHPGLCITVSQIMGSLSQMAESQLFVAKSADVWWLNQLYKSFPSLTHGSMIIYIYICVYRNQSNEPDQNWSWTLLNYGFLIKTSLKWHITICFKISKDPWSSHRQGEIAAAAPATEAQVMQKWGEQFFFVCLSDFV